MAESASTYVSPPPPGCGSTWRTRRSSGMLRPGSRVAAQDDLERVGEGEPRRVTPEPGERRLAERLTGLVDADDRRGQILRRGGRRNEAVLGLGDQLRRSVVQARDDDYRGPVGHRLYDDEAVALATRREDE